MPDLDFMDVAADLLSEMRLLVEGAITLYEDDLTALITPASKQERPDAHIALSDIGSALYSLRRHITQLQIECYKEAYRQAEQDGEVHVQQRKLLQRESATLSRTQNTRQLGQFVCVFLIAILQCAPA